jgi:hypothetical protein
VHVRVSFFFVLLVRSFSVQAERSRLRLRRRLAAAHASRLARLYASGCYTDMMLLLPCLHRCVCPACADVLMMAGPLQQRRCPKCRAVVERAVRVFED